MRLQAITIGLHKRIDSDFAQKLELTAELNDGDNLEEVANQLKEMASAQDDIPF